MEWASWGLVQYAAALIIAMGLTYLLSHGFFFLFKLLFKLLPQTRQRRT